MNEIQTPPLTKKDFESDQAVRWCPGCGDYAILAQTQKKMPSFGRKREEFVFVAGIGCSSRFPYYMNTYGFHTIHGRAPAVATGVKIANPDLSVWVVTGDGDGLSIGGNHFMHCLRRNMDLNILMFNNRIYGLTKGQYSPTSELGKKTKASPFGSIDYPLNPPSLALGAQATFVARTIDRWQKHLAEMMERSYAHDGASFTEIYQNCNIFNDGAFEEYTGADKFNNVIELKHNEPMVFAKGTKGIKLEGSTAVIVDLEKSSIDEVLIHDETNLDMAHIIANWTTHPILPEPIGVIYCIQKPTYNEEMVNQIDAAKKMRGSGKVQDLLNAGDTWVVD
ncbi:MAG: 2-oxoacid:ferredoxin oxidoreductase subunit beta [Candidatus Marinimicrobia bacterium]|jgi:2-oxoglutarate ferredoxin oxidoreductase subunit beta|nr:2-oxoacid:ferredoxin oxidoreductase subunit beta [Candidatus Neomarinimicrobiota bacterium]MBT3946201.1 2-oxoacid:ferredoxin oxidoreductase subunit beta [Candidatus Neomarinimicrobiota bacterium]MBT4154798.1 2-oxoacid:ferredoxin oxidoreductase subunit beta [Candidatus Neomarinimicrobiota bacterium]MBT4554317.1 2-oxoacid:ferredoxin oxidoreductase subunit beta [Candidatus Neomarinimicrobiota bacterium]MBT4753869.1 2-oxoacid:ferredoxin oxidoreductase subunit beta [Candidatus Neomarinimicrobiota|tara:strand:+ start:12950 stop:13957 length:1008 start_codon:yes stop_codon:yes gene_type:complete